MKLSEILGHWNILHQYGARAVFNEDFNPSTAKYINRMMINKVDGSLIKYERRVDISTGEWYIDIFAYDVNGRLFDVITGWNINYGKVV